MNIHITFYTHKQSRLTPHIHIHLTISSSGGGVATVKEAQEHAKQWCLNGIRSHGSTAAEFGVCCAGELGEREREKGLSW